MARKIKITQIRSAIKRLENQKCTIKALGLGKINKTVIHNDTPSIRGMINTVKHLVKFEEIDGE
ncbi:MAG: 50S ribosomal protein L30 [Fibrobacter sp.]|nr:50S ribosomal protein L30 [Fibrobacter sp.]